MFVVEFSCHLTEKQPGGALLNGEDRLLRFQGSQMTFFLDKLSWNTHFCARHKGYKEKRDGIGATYIGIANSILFKKCMEIVFPREKHLSMKLAFTQLKLP